MELEAEEFLDELDDWKVQEQRQATSIPRVTKVTFPSGQSLPVVSGPDGSGEEYYDPNNSGNPLLDTSGSNKSKQLSKNFTVGELAKSNRKKFDKARIDLELVECLQDIRDFVRKSVTVIEGYSSFKHWAKLAKQRGLKTVPRSAHLSGQGARIRVRGMSALELAKAAIVACYSKTRVSVGTRTVRIAVKQSNAQPSSYISNGKRRERAIKALQQYRTLYYDMPEEIEKDLKLIPRIGFESSDWRRAHRAAQRFVHWAVQEQGIHIKNLLTEILFYKFWYFQDRRQVKGKFDKRDEMDIQIWKDLRETYVLPALERRLPPKTQKGGVPTTPKGERVLADPNPDKPVVDITGRYEKAHYKDTSYSLGKVMSINQAGNHIEVIMTNVLQPKASQRAKRSLYRLHGDLQKDGAFRLFSRSDPDVAFRLIPKSKNLELEWKKSQKTLVETFSRRSTKPVLMEQSLKMFGKGSEIVRRYEWFPLLRRQEVNLNKFFGDSKKIEKYLKQFYSITRDSYKRYKEQLQSEAVAELDKAVKQVMEHPTSGIHRSDIILARFYIRLMLSLNQWRPHKSDPYLSQLDWIHRMLARVEYNDKHTSRTPFDHLGHTSNAIGFKNTSKKDADQNVYKITLKFSGVMAFFGAYKGKITIEKITEPKWPEGKVTFGIWFVAVGVGGGIKANETFSGTGTTPFNWLPQDFPGSVSLAFGGISASVGVGGSATGGFMHIHGRGMPVLQVPFSETGFSHSEEFKFKVGVELTEAIGKIQSKDLPIRVDYPSIKVKTDYSVIYGMSSEVHFGFNSALLTPAARQAIRVMCAHELPALMSPSSNIKIVAHTDRVGKEKDNLTLSALRAANTLQSIEDILGEKLDIPSQRIQATGRGEAEAKAKGDPDGFRNMDRRRVDIFLNSRLVLRLHAS